MMMGRPQPHQADNTKSQNNRRAIILGSVLALSVTFLFLLSSSNNIETTNNKIISSTINNNIQRDLRATTTNNKRKISSDPKTIVIKKPTTTLNTSNNDPKIPYTFIFTHSTNILETKYPPILYNNIINTIQKYKDAWRVTYSYSNPKIIFLDDNDCIDVITEVFPSLTLSFVNDPQKPHKGDICRIAALYKYGGYFFDTDLEAITPVLLSPSTEFASVTSTTGNELQNSFLASMPRHPILHASLRFMDRYYEGVLSRKVMFLGPQTLKWAYESVSLEPNKLKDVVLLQEFWLRVPFFANKYPELPRQEGFGCCCNFAIHAPKLGVVYFYTRTVGSSRKCSAVPLLGQKELSGPNYAD